MNLTMSEIEKTLKERGKRYGEYKSHSRISQNIKRAMQDSPNWAILDDHMRETLEITAHKIARILNGDPNYADNPHDICGYNKLSEDIINEQNL